MTPVTHVSSTGGHNNAPTTASEPRGSFTTARRKSSCSSRKRSSLAESEPLPRSGAPSITTRVGSPPVCESITFMRRTGLLSHKKTQKSQKKRWLSRVLIFLRRLNAERNNSLSKRAGTLLAVFFLRKGEPHETQASTGTARLAFAHEPCAARFFST